MQKSNFTAEPGQHSVIATRIFNAPRDLVFKVMTDPEAIPQWWGPRRYTTTVEKMEPRAGGSWRFVQHDAEGNEYAFRGVYHTVEASERTISTFEWEGLPGHVALDTTLYEDCEGGTKVTTISIFQTVEDRDGMMQSGAEEGAAEGHARLDDLLSQMLAHR